MWPAGIEVPDGGLLGEWGRVEDAFCEALVGRFLEAVYAIVGCSGEGQEGMAASGVRQSCRVGFLPLCRLPFHAFCGEGAREGFGSVLPLPYVLWSS